MLGHGTRSGMSILGGMRAGRMISRLDDLVELDDDQNRKEIDKLRALGPSGIKRLVEEIEHTDKSRAKFLSE